MRSLTPVDATWLLSVISKYCLLQYYSLWTVTSSVITDNSTTTTLFKFTIQKNL